MKRPTLWVFLALTGALLGLVWVERAPRRTTPPATAKTSTFAPSAPISSAAEPPTQPGPEQESRAGSGEAADENVDAGSSLADGGQVPELEGVTPKSVVFGVVLVQYAQAQGAPPGTRSRADAEKLANELAAVAKKDFKAAVDRGDAGSTVNAGRMFRGVLEPAPEFALFSLAVGDVSDPIDTPRGLWIVRRVE